MATIKTPTPRYAILTWYESRRVNPSFVKNHAATTTRTLSGTARMPFFLHQLQERDEQHSEGDEPQQPVASTFRTARQRLVGGIAGCDLNRSSHPFGEVGERLLSHQPDREERSERRAHQQRDVRDPR